MIADQEITWRPERNACCQTRAGQANPTLDVDLQIYSGGAGLKVKVDTDHACGIKQIEVQLRLIADPAQVWTLNARMTESFEWNFGPDQARQLPEPIGPSVSILVISISECATAARVRRDIRRF